jgi:hypothetical protein
MYLFNNWDFNNKNNESYSREERKQLSITPYLGWSSSHHHEPSSLRMGWKNTHRETHEPIVYGLKKKGKLCVAGVISASEDYLYHEEEEGEELQQEREEEENKGDREDISRFWLATSGTGLQNELHCVDYREQSNKIMEKIYPFEGYIMDLVVLTRDPDRLCITSKISKKTRGLLLKQFLLTFFDTSPVFL